MTVLHFAGWFQCRLSSDPDPTDEPRGVSGSSFATPGEPDLDRVIRFGPEGCVPRSHGPQIGVRVTAVSDAHGTDSPAHPALGAMVDLPGGAVFVEQNGAVVLRNTAFIDPFLLRVRDAEGRELLRRAALWDPDRPDLSHYDVPAATLAPRQPTLDIKSGEVVLEASGVRDVEAFLARRLAALQADLAASSDPVARAALEQRIEALTWTDWRGTRRNLLLAGRAIYGFTLNAHAAATRVDRDVFPEAVPAPWPVSFWMGAWDNDALCGYVSGSVTLTSPSPTQGGATG